jgi:hypothetical protein
MKNKEQIIMDMCYTYRHDYGLEKINGIISSGISLEERKCIYDKMKQLFENCIEPYMEFKINN